MLHVCDLYIHTYALSNDVGEYSYVNVSYMDFCPVVAVAGSLEFITNPTEFATM